MSQSRCRESQNEQFPVLHDNGSVTFVQQPSDYREDEAMFTLAVASFFALVSGFMLGRVWEIRRGMQQQTENDSARLPGDRHAALADRLTRPR